MRLAGLVTSYVVSFLATCYVALERPSNGLGDHLEMSALRLLVIRRLLPPLTAHRRSDPALAGERRQSPLRGGLIPRQRDPSDPELVEGEPSAAVLLDRAPRDCCRPGASAEGPGGWSGWGTGGPSTGTPPQPAAPKTALWARMRPEERACE